MKGLLLVAVLVAMAGAALDCQKTLPVKSLRDVCSPQAQTKVDFQELAKENVPIVIAGPMLRGCYCCSIFIGEMYKAIKANAAIAGARFLFHVHSSMPDIVPDLGLDPSVCPDKDILECCSSEWGKQAFVFQEESLLNTSMACGLEHEKDVAVALYYSGSLQKQWKFKKENADIIPKCLHDDQNTIVAELSNKLMEIMSPGSVVTLPKPIATGACAPFEDCSSNEPAPTSAAGDTSPTSAAGVALASSLLGILVLL